MRKVISILAVRPNTYLFTQIHETPNGLQADPYSHKIWDQNNGFMALSRGSIVEKDGKFYHEMPVIKLQIELIGKPLTYTYNNKQHNRTRVDFKFISAETTDKTYMRELRPDQVDAVAKFVAGEDFVASNAKSDTKKKTRKTKKAKKTQMSEALKQALGDA